jgi:hypothetical protein
MDVMNLKRRTHNQPLSERMAAANPDLDHLSINAPLFFINFAINSFALSMFIPMLQGDRLIGVNTPFIVLLTIPLLVV